jgi:hypothetical protein
MRWRPVEGHVPRGFCGATGELKDVELVLVCAEPGPPYDGEKHSGSPQDMLQSACSLSYEYFRNRIDVFSRNISGILDDCFPGMSFAEQMRRTWITNSVLCSAESALAEVPAPARQRCRKTYLDKQLRLLSHALVVALGGKATSRLKGTPGLLSVWAVAPPGGNRPEAKLSWKKIAERLRDERGRQLKGPIAGEPGPPANE